MVWFWEAGWFPGDCWGCVQGAVSDILQGAWGEGSPQAWRTGIMV